MNELKFACPRCRAPLGSKLVCPICKTVFESQDGIYHFLLPERELELKPFLSQYQYVRQKEGNIAHSADYYRSLPFVANDDPDFRRWHIRRQSFERLLGRLQLSPLRILDLGAGNCWLTHRLIMLGHQSVAVDISTNCDDGLGARKYYSLQFMCVQADFDSLPFMPGQFDVAIFNASLHYSPDVDLTLTNIKSMLKQSGMIIVLDSPTFRNIHAGQQMISDRDEHFRRDLGLHEIIQHGSGYLTNAQMRSAGFRFQASSSGFLGTVRRLRLWTKLQREPAAFGVWEGKPH